MTDPTNVTILEPERPPLTALLITCDTGGCGWFWASPYSYAKAHLEATDAGFRTDVTGLIRCPSCVAARLPSPGLYLDGADLTAWLDGLLAARDDLAEPEAAGPEPELEPLPEDIAADSEPDSGEGKAGPDSESAQVSDAGPQDIAEDTSPAADEAEQASRDALDRWTKGAQADADEPATAVIKVPEPTGDELVEDAPAEHDGTEHDGTEEGQS